MRFVGKYVYWPTDLFTILYIVYWYIKVFDENGHAVVKAKVEPLKPFKHLNVIKLFQKPFLAAKTFKKLLV